MNSSQARDLSLPAEPTHSRAKRANLLQAPLCLAFLSLFLLSCQPSTPAPRPPELPLETAMAPGPGEGLPASWWIPLRAGESFRATVVQLGVDVVVDLLRPDGELLLSVDRNIGRLGPETVCFVDDRKVERADTSTDESAGIVLRIRRFSPASGPSRAIPYKLTLEHQGPAQQTDRDCAQALRAYLTVVQRSPDDDPTALLALAETAEQRWAAAGLPFERAVVRAEMAALAHERKDLSAEIRYREQALALLDHVTSDGPNEVDVEGVASLHALLLNDLGLAYGTRGEPEAAERCFTRALSLYESLGDLTAQATVLNNRARLLAAQGAAHEAMEVYRRVGAIAAREGAPRLQAFADLNLGSTLSSMGDLPRAQDALSDALELFLEIGDQEGQATTSTAIGWVHTLQGRQHTAMEWYGRALRLAEETDTPAVETEARDRMGTALRKLGRFDEARDSYRRALELSRGLERPVDAAHVLANLGWLEVEAGRPREAIERLTAARALFEELGHPDPLSYTLAGLAGAYRQLGRLDEALAWMENAGELVEEERGLARSRGHRLLGVPLWPDYRELLVDLLIELDAEHPGEGYDRRAFQEADLARARHLSETLQDAFAHLRDEAPPELLARERALQEVIRRRHSEGEDAEGQGAALRGLLAELEDVRSAIRRTSPRLADLSDPKAVSVEELQGLLEPGTLLLSYFLGDERSFAFLVSVDTFAVVELAPRDQLDRLARAVYEALRAPHGASTQLALTAPALSESILAPVLPHLERAGTERILVAADGMLHYLPFAALPWPGDTDLLMLDRFELISVPSATVAVTLRRSGRGAWTLPDRVAVLADPDYPPGGSLPPLPHSRQEAEAIERTLSPLLGRDRIRLALGAEARPELVTGGELVGTGLLHVASHALIDERQPELSRIALSGGELSLHEILGLNLGAELVVLSGCRTALGESVRGEGLVGLTRGFFHAGVPRLVVSLWPVDDLATAQWMERFYEGLAQGLRPAAALARAQEEMRHTPGREAPVHWAGFVLQGDWR